MSPRREQDESTDEDPCARAEVASRNVSHILSWSCVETVFVEEHLARPTAFFVCLDDPDASERGLPTRARGTERRWPKT